MDDLIGKRINSIKTDSQTHHIELSTRITFYPGCITDMTQYLMLKSLLQTFRSSFKHFYLSARKRIKLSPVTAYQWENTERGITAVCFFRRSISSGISSGAKPKRCIPVSNLI